jgi:two-component SAPR family response regulator
MLVLDDAVGTDVAEFEERIETARRSDGAGTPARALAAATDALGWYRGDYLLGVPAGWPLLTRLRLRALAVDAACRVAELTAARGEPDDAARWAERARHIDPLSERAARIFVASLLAAGHRASAAAAAAEFEAAFVGNGIAIEASTRRVFDRTR